MAQFDSLIIFPLLWSLLLTLFLYYNMSIKILIPDFFGTKKWRVVKLTHFREDIKDIKIIQDLYKSDRSYLKIV